MFGKNMKLTHKYRISANKDSKLVTIERNSLFEHNFISCFDITVTWKFKFIVMWYILYNAIDFKSLMLISIEKSGSCLRDKEVSEPRYTEVNATPHVLTEWIIPTNTYGGTSLWLCHGSYWSISLLPVFGIALERMMVNRLKNPWNVFGNTPKLWGQSV